MAFAGVPFFQLIGNHDLDEAAGAVRDSRKFEAAFGPTYYSFNHGAVHYVVLDNVFWIGNGYVGYLDDPQLDWLAADLKAVEGGSKVVVFAHIPFASTITDRLPGFKRNQSRVANRDRLYELLEPYSAHLLTAHTHENEHILHAGCHEHVLATACGAWWTGPVCWDGTPKGYHVYEVRGEQLSWRFKASGLAADKQLRLYRPGSEPQNPDEIIANVWNWHPSWQVYWYEDGERRGEMSRRRGRDPLTVSLYEGPTRPLGNASWVEPLDTDHLFYAAPRPGASEVTVEAIDPWGGVFTEKLDLTAPERLRPWPCP